MEIYVDNKELARKVYDAYFENDIKVMIISMYVDEFADLEERDGEIYISSEVWADQMLVELNFPVRLYKEVCLEEM